MIIKKRSAFLLTFLLLVSVFSNSVIGIGENLGEGLGSGGDIEQNFQGAMQAVQQIMQIITQIVGNLKSTLEANANAENTRLAKINAPRLPDDPSDEQAPEILDSETTDTRVAMDFKGLAITLEDRNTGNKLIIQNRANVVGSFNTNKSLENTITENTTTLVNKEGQDLGIVKVGNHTTLIDSAGADVIPIEDNLVVKGFLPLVSAVEISKGVTIFDTQYVVFKEADVFINGEDILFFPLKEFNNIIITGNNLVIMEKDSDILVNGDKTFYSRDVGTNEFKINKIINENNKKIVFSLLNGGSNGVYFIDNKNMLSVGDAVVKNPLEDYENVSIPSIRLGMWKKAAESV